MTAPAAPTVSQDAVQCVLDRYWSSPKEEGVTYTIEKLIKPSQNYTYLATKKVELSGGSEEAEEEKVIVRAVPQAWKALSRLEAEAEVLGYLKVNHPTLPTTSLIPHNKALGNYSSNSTSSSSTTGGDDKKSKKSSTPSASAAAAATNSGETVRGDFIAWGYQHLPTTAEATDDKKQEEEGKQQQQQADPTLAVMMCSFAEGRPVDVLGLEWMTNKEIAYHCGYWMGRFHKICKSKKFNDGSRGGPGDLKTTKVRPWTQIHDNIMEKATVDPRDLELAKDPNFWGVLHGDVNCSNYFIIEEEEGEEKQKKVKDLFAFDWDQVQVGWYMFDLAQMIHGPEMMQVGGMSWSPIYAEEDTEKKGPVIGYGECPVQNIDDYAEWVINGYEDGHNSNTDGIDGSKFGFKVDRPHLQRMRWLRQDFYTLFAERELAAPTLPQGMVNFCKYIIVATEKMNAKFPNRGKE